MKHLLQTISAILAVLTLTLSAFADTVYSLDECVLYPNEAYVDVEENIEMENDDCPDNEVNCEAPWEDLTDDEF